METKKQTNMSFLCRHGYRFVQAIWEFDSIVSPANTFQYSWETPIMC